MTEDQGIVAVIELIDGEDWPAIMDRLEAAVLRKLN